MAIVASGPSLKKAEVEQLRDRIHVVAINTSYRVATWADMLYACDAQWWRAHGGAADFPGLKVTQDLDAKRAFPDLVRIPLCRPSERGMLMDRFGEIGAGGNSAFQAVNLCVQLGATAIALLGVDLTGEHWHGRHPKPLMDPSESNFRRWRENFDGAARQLASWSVDVVNCSPISTIRAFPKLTVNDMLRRWQL